MGKKIIRVFPHKTRATPIDEDVRIRTTPGLFDNADEVHISVTFSWDLPWAEWAANQWKVVAPVKVGGPAFEQPGDEFVPGMYLKHGYTITSRGCPNKCWFCSVPRREKGIVRELKVQEGWILQDDNLLACSVEHINKVIAMLKKQPHRPEFRGGLEAKLFTTAIAEKLLTTRPKSMYFAYDTEDDLEPLIEAGKILRNLGIDHTKRIAYCYVLCGFPKDTIPNAEKRMKQAWEAGFIPFSMLYRDYKGKTLKEWQKFQRQWADGRIRSAKLKELNDSKTIKLKY